MSCGCGCGGDLEEVQESCNTCGCGTSPNDDGLEFELELVEEQSQEVEMEATAICNSEGVFGPLEEREQEKEEKENLPGCNKCGKEQCRCNNDLKAHLKECYGYGNLPPLVEKCYNTPEPGNRFWPICAGIDKSGGDQKPPRKCNCGCSGEPKKEESSCEKKDLKDPRCEFILPKEIKILPMPVADCCNCKPAWFDFPPPVNEKAYPAPEGVNILPISEGGHRPEAFQEKRGSSCGACGRFVPDKPSTLNKDCPVMKPRPGADKPKVNIKCGPKAADNSKPKCKKCPKKEKEKETKEDCVGMFDKIASAFFGR